VPDRSRPRNYGGIGKEANAHREADRQQPPCRKAWLPAGALLETWHIDRVGRDRRTV